MPAQALFLIFGSNGITTQTMLVDSFTGLGPHLIFVQAMDANGCVAFDTIVVIINNCIGIDDISVKVAEIKINPNPSEGDVDISFSKISENTILLEIFNPEGQIVDKKTIKESKSDFQMHLNLKNLPDGIYLLKFNIGDNIITKRIVISH